MKVADNRTHEKERAIELLKNSIKSCNVKIRTTILTRKRRKAITTGKRARRVLANGGFLFY